MNAPSRAEYALPRRISLEGLTVLDVGCGDGRDFLHPEFSGAHALYGVDIDKDAIARGGRLYPQLRLSYATAENLPFESETFDVLMSRVTLPYTDIRASLREISRVVKPGGYVFLTMHDLHMQLTWLAKAVRTGSWRRVLDHGYIFPASVMFNIFGRCFVRPWNGRPETFQTRRSIRRELARARFEVVDIRRTAKPHFIVEAFKR